MFKHKNKFLILMILMLFITISSISAQDTSNLATDNIDDISAADQPSIQLSDSGSSSNVLGVGENNDILGGQDPNLIFNPANNTTINYGEAFAITITGPSNLCELNISVDDGQPFKLAFNGNARLTNFDLPSLGAGDHTLTIKYPANGDYDEQSYTYKIAVTGKEVPITVEDVKIIYGQTATIVATGLSEIKGEEITIEIEGKGSKVVQVDDNGNATAVFDGLAAGNYTITASYAGGSPYLPNSTTAKLTVDKADTTLEITLDPELPIYDGNTFIVNFIVNENATGTINFKINDGKTRNLTISEGAAQYTVKKAIAVDYVITASYAGDNNFNSAEGRIEFTVNDKPELLVTAEDITYGDVAIINVTLPSGAEIGNLSVSVNGTDYDTFVVFGDNVYVYVPNLTAGDYNVTATYEDLVNTTSFTVDKANTTLDIIIEPGLPIYDGDAVIFNFIVDKNATGTINFKINGKTHRLTISDGAAQYTVKKARAGDYNITASYAGDDNFNSAEASIELTVDTKLELLVTAENITYGDDEVITVILPYGGFAEDLTVIVNNVAYTDGFVQELNVVTLNLSGLNAGEYNVKALFLTGPSTLIQNTTTFNVAKAASSIVIDVEDVYYVGDEVVITLTPSFAGIVTVLINDESYVLEDDYTITIEDAVYGNYNIEATLAGDDNHNESIAYSDFEVIKYPTELIIGDIYTDDELYTIIPISIDHVSDLTVSGNVTVTIISGEIIVDEFTSDNFVGDEIEVNAGVLEPGDYTFVVTYNGNENYDTSFDSADYTVPTTGYELLVSATNITYGDDEVITVILPYGGFAEDLTVIVNNAVYDSDDFVQELNVVTLNLSGLNAGEYNVKALFLTGASTLIQNTTAFNVAKAASFIEIEVDDTYYVGDEVVITFIPSTDSTIFYSINGEYEIAPANKTITLTAVNGTYVVTAFLDADENHNVSEEVSTTFAVYKLTPEIDVLYFDEYVVGTDVDIVVYGPEDPTAELLIEGAGLPTNHTDAFDGEYEVSYGNNLGIGEYTLTVTYYENDKYVRYSTTVTFNVIDREDTILYIDSIDTNKTTDVTTIDITITDAEGSPFDISGNVTVYVYNGDEVVGIVQSDELDSCKFTLDLGVIEPGEYNFTAVYSGNTYYKESNATKVYEVPKVSEYPISVEATNIVYNETEVIIAVTLPSGAKKDNLTVIVNNVVYRGDDFDQYDDIVYLSIAGLDAGDYDVEVTYVDDVYGYLTNTTNFTVSPAESSIEIIVDTVYYVDDTVYILLVPSIDNGEIYVYINDEEQIVTDNTVTIENAVFGNYTVEAFLIGDINHNDSYDEAEFNVLKLNPAISADYELEYMIGTEAYITVYGPNDRIGTILINGNFTVYDDEFVGENIYSFGNNLQTGDYSVNITYYENDKYEEYKMTVSFTVIDRYESKLAIDSITTDKIDNTTSIDITITDMAGLPFDISGNVTVYVYNGDEVVSIVQSDELEDCKVTINLGEIEPGEYNFTAVYNGNTYYKESNATKAYEVPLVSNYNLFVFAEDIIYDENATIYVVLPEKGNKDNLIIIVDNIVYTSDKYEVIAPTFVALSIEGLDVAVHNVTVQYVDDVYGYLTNTTNFTVSPAESSIEIIVDKGYYVDDEIVIVLIPSIDDGEIIVYINGEPYEVEDNTVTLTAVYGNYTVEAYLIGDKNHNDSDDEAEFTVFKLDPEIYADYEFEYMVGTEAYITIYGPDDRNGTMLIYGNSTDITFTFDGEYRFSLGNDSEIGDYKFEIMYLENDKYYTDSIDVEFSVIDRYGTDLTIDSIVTDKTNNITTIGITITDADGYPFDISGNVTVYIYDDEGLVNEVTSDELVNCKFTVDLGEIDPGEYEFVAVYNGNTYYKGSADGKDYEVPLVSNYELPVYVEDIIYDETATICVILPDRADKDYLVIIVDNTVYSSEEYDQYENIVTLDVTGLDAGEHTVSVLYKDDVYDLQQNATEFDVDPAESSIEIEVDGYYFVDDEIVITLIPSIDDGEIVVLINGEEYEVIDNTVTLTAVYGNYTVEAFLIGDDNHYDSEDDAEFEVYKLEPQIDVDYLDEYMVGTEISIVVYGPDDRIGTILINGNFTEFNDEFIGDYEFLLSENAEIGDYTIKVTYYENDKYVEESMEIEFTVIDRFETDLTIDSITTDKTNNITSIGISITDAEGYPFAISGNVTVYIYDEYGDLVGEVTSDADTCKVTIDLGEIDPGNYEFEAIYSGNTDYKDSSDVKDYEVPLVSNYELPVYASDIIYNQTAAIIAVIVPDRADKDYLTIIVDNTVYSSEEYSQYANIVTLFVPGLDAGNHIVKVQYKDDVYDLKENTTSFTVIPAASSIEIVVDSVYFVDDEIVITLIPSIDDGEISVFINDEEYEVIDNTVTLTAVYGDYTVEAYLIGDKNHNDSSADAEFTVLKLDPEISVNFTETHAGYNIPVIVTLPEDATGTVLIEIDGNIYGAHAENGTATTTIPSLDAGNYTAKVTYQGDDKYNQFTEDMTLDIENYYELNVPDVVKYYHGGERLYVYALFNGKAAAEETVTIIINGISYTKKTDKNGVASLAINLNSGNYSVRVKWNDLEANSTVEVKPTIDGHNVAKVFRNDTQYYATFYDSNGDVLANKIVTFNINGVFYNRTTDENGVAKLNINLNPGEYIITALNPVTQEMISNNISVLSHFIEHDDLEKIYGSATPFVVRLCNDRGQIADAGELVKFNINGVMYEKLSDIDGFVKLNINLQPGQYIITSYYKDEAVSNIITVRSE